MILDSLLFSKIKIIGNTLLDTCGLCTIPQNIKDMEIFLQELKNSIDNNDFKGVLIADILFSFVSNIDIRDRNTTSRTFEDIFSSLFNSTCTDGHLRNNPNATPKIIEYDRFCINEGWKISTDLSSNKREKTDLVIDKYNISLKTLKGVSYDKDNNIIDNSFNHELNIGSFSYRALLKGIIPDNYLQSLSDRKNGLGSGAQLRKNIFNPILSLDKHDEFYLKLKDFLTYVYEDDIYIVLKSHYRIDFILIPNDSFINTLLKLYSEFENDFEKVFYRWENNNLRINWKNLLYYMNIFNYNYYNIEINLKNINNNNKLDDMKLLIQKDIENYLKSNL